ncbi:ANKK1 [Branchiostoma lanceolatum]|uniref:ANKK1 protein n=1 Tax=Branchiostoma lanceolatum TaxID=7740 RepID=A0A8K0A0F3_BRALA|nr:ANKK1 [Branchiostoma lanceolatum]
MEYTVKRAAPYVSNSHTIAKTSTTVQSVDLPVGCNLRIPSGATTEDTSVISAVLNPHGYDGKLKLRDDELLVSEIIEIGPPEMSFSKRVKLKISYSLPKFDCEREYFVMTSRDEGKTWKTFKPKSGQKQGQRSLTVKVKHFGPFVVVSKLVEHSHSVVKERASTLRSSEQTGFTMSLPEKSLPCDEEISFKVIPVDSETLKIACSEKEGAGIDSMSHIVKFIKGSNLLLNRPATIVLPLLPGKESSQVRVLSCNGDGEWEDVINKVNPAVLEGSKVSFQTNQLSNGFAVLRCDKIVDPTVINMIAKATRARRVKAVIFKKWKEPREEGMMTARIECLVEAAVEDRICRAETQEGYERQEGTPTPAMVIMEGEPLCAIFRGSIRPDVESINGLYGKDFTFYCERIRVLEFDAKLVDRGEAATSKVRLYLGRRKCFRPAKAGRGSVPLATTNITAPTSRELGGHKSADSGAAGGQSRELGGHKSADCGASGGHKAADLLCRKSLSTTVHRSFPVIDFQRLDFPKESHLGTGGFGTVRKAYHRDFERDVAVKSLLTGQIHGSSEQDLLYSEARKLQLAGESPYVISLLGVCLEPHFAIVMPYMTNGCLAGLLRDVDVPGALRWRMAHEAAMGMVFLHSQKPQILHCDLKAENLLLDDNFHVKISDFGLSKWKDHSQIVTSKSPRGDTITHAPPEHLEDINCVPTDKSDVYSFGVLLWEIVTRDRPYKHAVNSAHIGAAVTEGQRPDMTVIRTDLHGAERVCELMNRCLSQLSKDRPSFEECVQHLYDVNSRSSDEDIQKAISDVRRMKAVGK